MYRTFVVQISAFRKIKHQQDQDSNPNANTIQKFPQDPHPNLSERKANRIQRLWHQWRGYQEEPGEEKLQGTIQAVHIGKRSDGQLMGCAYFRFECTEQMAQSMLQDEDNRLVGRSVLADWQFPKKRHISCCW